MELGLLRREWELLSIDEAEAAELQRRGIICCDEFVRQFFVPKEDVLVTAFLSPSAINRCALKTTTQDFSARILEGIDRFLGEGLCACREAVPRRAPMTAVNRLASAERSLGLRDRVPKFRTRRAVKEWVGKRSAAHFGPLTVAR